MSRSSTTVSDGSRHAMPIDELRTVRRIRDSIGLCCSPRQVLAQLRDEQVNHDLVLRWYRVRWNRSWPRVFRGSAASRDCSSLLRFKPVGVNGVGLDTHRARNSDWLIHR